MKVNFSLASVIMLLIVVVYAICASAIKTGLQFAPPLLFGTLRAFLAAIFLLAWLVLTGQRFFPTRIEWPKILQVGIAATTIGYGMMFISPGRTSAGIASVLGNLQPLFTIVLAAVLLKEYPRRKDVAALLLGIFGITLISFFDFSGKSTFELAGMGAALLASGGAAAGSVLMKKLSVDSNILRITAWQLLIGAILLWLWSLSVENNRSIVWSPAFIAILLFLAIIGTAVPTAVWYYLIQSHPVGKLSLFFFLIPVFGLLMASLVFRETLRSNEVMGLVFIVLSALIIAINSKEQTA